MTDDERLADPVAAAAQLPKGSFVILRSRDAKKRRALAKALQKIPGLILLAAEDPWLADRLHGLHLPETRARQAAHWRAVRPRWIITVAAHSARALRISHIDAALLSPVFPTKSHPHASHLGAARARLMARESTASVIALGGIDAQNALLLKGFSGVAAISAFLPG